MKKIIGVFLATAISTGCAIDPYTGEEKVANTAWGIGAGAAVGAASGLVIGGNTKGALIGAASGAALGGGIGYYMDRQEAKLRHRLEGTGVRIQRVGNDLKLIMPSNITFAVDSSHISGHFLPVLESVAIVLKEFDDTSIDVAGYTDSTGSFEHNQNLSENRARSVTNVLVQSGIRSGRIQSRGFGERYPIAPNNAESGRAQNRRVEINIRPR